MTAITDAEMAAIWHRRRGMGEPCELHAPCAHAVWDGRVLNLRATGLPLDAETAAAWPQFAALFEPVLALPLADPTVAALEADYDATTALEPARRCPQGLFRARLVACRGCKQWDETARDGRGRCDCVNCHCTRRMLWLAGEACPESRWPA